MYFTLRVKLKAKDTNIIMHNKRVVSEDQLNFNSGFQVSINQLQLSQVAAVISQLPNLGLQAYMILKIIYQYNIHSWNLHPFIKKRGGGVSFQNFQKMGEGSDFSHKKGGFGKIWGCFKKGVSLIFILISPFLCYLSLSVLVCVCFVYLHHFCQYYLCFTGRTQSYSI